MLRSQSFYFGLQTNQQFIPIVYDTLFKEKTESKPTWNVASNPSLHRKTVCMRL